MSKAQKFYQIAMYYVPGIFGLLFFGFMALIAEKEVAGMVLMIGSTVSSILFFVFAGMGYYHEKKSGGSGL